MKKLFSFIFATMLAGQAWAQTTFTINDLLYTVIDEENHYVSVGKGSTAPTGDLVVPESIENESTIYIVKSIPDNAFPYCYSLTSVTIPESVTSIGDYAFYSCQGLTSVTIPESVTSIGNVAFGDCSGLTSVTIPESVTSIGNGAFDSNGLIYNEYDNAYYLGNARNPYLWLIKTKSRGITTCVINENCKFINSYAFMDCGSLTSVIIPNSVMTIGSLAFGYCNSLKSVTIPNSVKYIDGAFYDCNNIETLTYNTDAIGGMFCGVTSLKTINIGDSVTTISEYAFSGCSGLTTVTIPSSVTNIGNHVFEGCSATIYCEVASKPSNWASAWAGRNTIYWNVRNRKNNNNFVFSTISDKNPCQVEIIKYTGDSIVANVPTTVEFDGKEYAVTRVRSGAFSGYNNLDYTAYGNAFYIGNEENPYLILMEAKNTKIESCEISRRCRFIYGEAFNGCSKLSEISIPDSVINIGNNAFSGCSSLSKASFASVEQICGIVFENSAANPLSVVHHLYIDTTEVTNLVIPKAVKSIGDYAFYGCNYISSVKIPNSVETIGDYAFFNCNGMESIAIGDSVERIGGYTFSGCSRLTSIYIPKSVENIGNSAFANCYNLQKSEFASIESLCGIDFGDANANPLSITKQLYAGGEKIVNLVIPETVKSIGSYAFYNCTSIASLTIADSVERIGSQAFYGCSRLASVEVPNSITNIGTDAFKGCNYLKSLSYNSNAIGAHFNNISALESIFIGDSVKNISGTEFNGCDNLVNVISMAAVPPTLNGDPYTFADTIWVPAASVDAYKAAPVWKRKEIMPLDYYTVSVAKTDTTRGSVIGDGNFAAKQAITIYATPTANYHFKAWSDGNTENPRTIMLNGDVNISAIFEGDTRVININANVSSSGSVSSDVSSYHFGDTITITASANSGYHFVKWSDGVTDNPRIAIIDGDLSFEAIFEADENQGGENPGGNENNPGTAVAESASNAVNIYTHSNTIVVENATDEIFVYNAMGALVCRDAINRVRAAINVNTSGVYIVKTGGAVKRVMVN